MAQNHTAGSSGAQDRGARPPRGGNPGYGDQSSSAGGMADSASEMWDSAYEQGARYYRQGSRAVGSMETTTLTGLIVAGAVGFGLAWLLLNQRYGTDDVARRMSESSDRYGRDHGRGRHRS